MRSCITRDASDQRTIVVLSFSSKRIGEQPFGDRLNELLLPLHQHVTKAVHSTEPTTVGQRARRVNRETGFILLSPSPDRTEVLEREPKRIHPGMTACAHRVVAMRLQTLADRSGFPCLSTLRQG